MATTPNAAYILRTRYNLKRTQLYHYHKCVKEDIKIHEGNGRPRVIDDEGVEEIMYARNHY